MVIIPSKNWSPWFLILSSNLLLASLSIDSINSFFTGSAITSFSNSWIKRKVVGSGFSAILFDNSWNLSASSIASGKFSLNFSILWSLSFSKDSCNILSSNSNLSLKPSITLTLSKFNSSLSKLAKLCFIILLLNPESCFSLKLSNLFWKRSTTIIFTDSMFSTISNGKSILCFRLSKISKWYNSSPLILLT